MDKLKDVLEDSLSRLNLKKRIKENMAVLVWEEIAGQELARQTAAVYINDGVLFVKVKNPVWAHQLTFLKNNLLAKIAARTGNEAIRDIRFQIGEIKRKKRDTAKSEEYHINWDKISIEPARVRWAEEIAAGIADPEIRDIFRRLVISAEKKREWGLAAGGKVCPVCHTVHTAPGRKCPVCRMAEK